MVIEALKRRFNGARGSNLCFYREQAGHEVDLIQPVGQALIGVEIKAGATISSDAFAGLARFADRFADRQTESVLVHGGDVERVQQGATVTHCRGLAPLLDTLESGVGES